MKILFLILFLCIFAGGALIGYGLGTMRALDIIGKELRSNRFNENNAALNEIIRKL